MNKMKIIVVCGPTGSGKTRLSIDLAKKYDGEIISADSMQIYRHMDIATAKPTAAEQQGIPHHLMDFLEPSEVFSVADYVKLAGEVISQIHSRGKMPIVVGGTGLYITSIVDNIIFDDTSSDLAFRREMEEFADKNGNEQLFQLLIERDLDAAKKLHPNNRSRVIRALEVYHISGKKISDLQRMSKSVPSPYQPIMIGLTASDRNALYERINLRVDNMLSDGLIEEAKAFYNNEFSATSMQAIGYKELKPYIDGICEKDECVEKLKQETRKYAKRQLTWLKKDARINWINIDEYDNYEKIFENAEKIIKKYGI